MSKEETSPLVFTAEELDLLGRTADALSAYMGKPVLAEIMDAQETGFEWVIFAIPLDVQDNPDDYVLVQIGGAGARYVGNTGGMTISDDEVYDCEYLWAIQLSDLEGVRYIKVDQEGDEVAWADKLQDILPFIMIDDAADNDTNDEDDDEDDGLPDLDGSVEPRTLH
ncbi:hypothetical protein [Pollutimonas harenae]|uniref:Uncharacterized protein n=1 Tax=Pollutimonas harenae TaxID=657015 RepID=A0A853H5D6_9BURK|nr:hypothetical protein [Pollutimonas harenae]NYT85324.1 hypothetical protein [Pollutimonas harenae]TEA70427.1 hypothetical protein ERD84_06950 [Pollutimonas harenae]